MGADTDYDVGTVCLGVFHLLDHEQLDMPAFPSEGFGSKMTSLGGNIYIQVGPKITLIQSTRRGVAVVAPAFPTQQ